MRLIIAEKPSLARSVANGIEGLRLNGDGFIQVNGQAGDTTVTWCYGHLYELAEPEHYNPAWKKWRTDLLPMTIAPGQWKLLAKKDSQAQIRVIARLLKSATEVIHAGDPDREGQMLVDEVLDELKWKGPTQRLLLHDTTPASVRKALKKLQPNAHFAPLYQAAQCRSQADWLVGMNLTRAASLKMGVTVSIGRVQTPTLALVVRRDLAIEGHTSSVFYTLHATVNTAKGDVVLVHDTEHDRITDKVLAQAIAKALTGKAVVLSVTEKTITEQAPLPFTLPRFQKAAEARYGWTAKQALDILQKAYEQQLVSYPRTDCPYLPEEQAGQAVPMVRTIINAGHFAVAKPLLNSMQASQRVYDDKKVAQHHGLTPTSKLPSSAPPDVKRAWELVTEQFLKSLLPAYKATVKTVAFEYEGREFKASAETALNADTSWRVLEPKEPKTPLPALPDGSKGQVASVVVKQGKTTPPKPYTEAALIADMGNVHKFVEDPKLKALLKENAGIGTAATQGAIIETLKRRKYVELTGRGKTKHLRSTELGRTVIARMPDALSNPGITALWEEQLGAIAAGNANPAEFMTRIDAYVKRNLERIAAG